VERQSDREAERPSGGAMRQKSERVMERWKIRIQVKVNL
jgi:hypothetical protein